LWGRARKLAAEERSSIRDAAFFVRAYVQETKGVELEAMPG